MIFVLGILTGISICSFLILSEIWLSKRSIGLNRIRSIIKQQTSQQAQILKPRSQQDKDIEQIISENERMGKDTPIEDLYK